jgi:uncharacterized protein (DUF488 family)
MYIINHRNNLKTKNYEYFIIVNQYQNKLKVVDLGRHPFTTPFEALLKSFEGSLYDLEPQKLSLLPAMGFA